MVERMTQSFKFLISNSHFLSEEKIAGVLHHICGGTRYLQDSAFIVMPLIAHSIDCDRHRAIYEEWMTIMKPEMEKEKNLRYWGEMYFPVCVFKLCDPHCNLTLHQKILQ